MHIADHFPFSEFRQHQKETLDKIETALKTKKFVLVNAPTGSGKSVLAISIAKYFADTNILTTQRSLQDQYAETFPDLVVMKGKGNYPCAVDESMTCAKGPCKTNKSLQCADKELKFQECPFYIAVAEAQAAAVVLHNFASFMYQTRYAKLFEPREALIIDECHNVELMIMGFVSFKIYASALGYVIPMKERIEDYLAVMEDIKESIKGRISAIKNTAASAMTDRLLKHKLTEEIEDLEKTQLKIDFFLGQANDLDNWVFNTELDDNGDLKSLEIKPVFVSRFAREFLFNYGNKVVCMSATIEPVSFARSLGIDHNDITYIEVPSTFPKENRPIWRSYVGRINNKTIDTLMPAIVEKVRKCLAHYPDSKGIIHTHTYKISNAIKNAIPSNRLIFHGNGSGVSREEAIERHMMSPHPTVLVSPSMTEGLDLQGETGRWQLICKVPYGMLGDQQIATRSRKDPLWYQWCAVLAICQASGRVVRSASDHGETYIIDETFERLLSHHRKLFPTWFLEAIR